MPQSSRCRGSCPKPRLNLFAIREFARHAVARSAGFPEKFGNARGFEPAPIGLYISTGGLIGRGAAMGSWTLEDIPWRRVDGAKVEPDLLRIVQASGLVEQNSADYAQYLCGVFHDDPAFQQDARRLSV